MTHPAVDSCPEYGNTQPSSKRWCVQDANRVSCRCCDNSTLASNATRTEKLREHATNRCKCTTIANFDFAKCCETRKANAPRHKK